MGAPIGFFSDDTPTDYPELNKCPDCETFFAAEHCPLCGKLCPTEMRAGNRRAVKQKRKGHDRSNGRVRFVPWYHRPWFVVAMLIVMPIVGLILLWQSDMRKGWKIALTLLPFAQTILSWLLMMLTGVLGMLGWLPEEPPPEEAPASVYAEPAEAADDECLWQLEENIGKDDRSI